MSYSLLVLQYYAREVLPWSYETLPNLFLSMYLNHTWDLFLYIEYISLQYVSFPLLVVELLHCCHVHDSRLLQMLKLVVSPTRKIARVMLKSVFAGENEPESQVTVIRGRAYPVYGVILYGFCLCNLGLFREEGNL